MLSWQSPRLHSARGLTTQEGKCTGSLPQPAKTRGPDVLHALAQAPWGSHVCPRVWLSSPLSCRSSGQHRGALLQESSLAEWRWCPSWHPTFLATPEGGRAPRVPKGALAAAAKLCPKATPHPAIHVALLPAAPGYCFILRLVILSEVRGNKVWQPANAGLSFAAHPAAHPCSCAGLPGLQETRVSSDGIPTVQSNGNGPNPAALASGLPAWLQGPPNANAVGLLSAV